MAVAASIITALLILPIFFMQDKAEDSLSVDQFVSEIASMTDPEKIDPSIFFEETAQAPEIENIDEFLDGLFEKPSDPIENREIWEIFTKGEKARG
mgnify:FL=1